MRLVAAVACVAMIFAACGSSKSNGSKGTTKPSTTAAPAIVDGGTLTVGADQEADCTDQAKPVVTYKSGKTFSGWKALFAGGVGILPSHLLKGKDRDALMKNGYTWSGGPWIAKWTKGDNITLTPNANYWGKKPHL